MDSTVESVVSLAPQPVKLDIFEYQQQLLKKIDSLTHEVLKAENIYVASGGRAFEIQSDLIQEVASVPPMTRIPGSKPWVLGIGNLRARVIPIIGLDSYLGNPQSTHGLICLVLKSSPVAIAVTLIETPEQSTPLDVTAVTCIAEAFSQQTTSGSN